MNVNEGDGKMSIDKWDVCEYRLWVKEISVHVENECEKIY